MDFQFVFKTIKYNQSTYIMIIKNLKSSQV